MPLPAAEPRKSIHTRQIVYECYRRDDGFWDIDGRLADIKDHPYVLQERGLVPPQEPIHDMAIRVTFDDTLTIRDIVSSMTYAPFGACQQAREPLRGLIGVTAGPGWRFAIEKAIGGVKGCTHLRDLLLNMATAAFQSIPGYVNNKLRMEGTPLPASTTPPHHLGKCMSWAFDSAVVKEYQPDFYLWKPRQPAEESR